MKELKAIQNKLGEQVAKTLKYGHRNGLVSGLALPILIDLILEESKKGRSFFYECADAPIEVNRECLISTTLIHRLEMIGKDNVSEEASLKAISEVLDEAKKYLPARALYNPFLTSLSTCLSQCEEIAETNYPSTVYTAHARSHYTEELDKKMADLDSFSKAVQIYTDSLRNKPTSNNTENQKTNKESFTDKYKSKPEITIITPTKK